VRLACGPGAWPSRRPSRRLRAQWLPDLRHDDRKASCDVSLRSGRCPRNTACALPRHEHPAVVATPTRSGHQIMVRSRDSSSSNSYCRIRECSPADRSLPHSNVPQAFLLPGPASHEATDSTKPVRPSCEDGGRSFLESGALILTPHAPGFPGVDRTEHHGVRDFAAPDVQPTLEGSQKPIAIGPRYSTCNRASNSRPVRQGSAVPPMRDERAVHTIFKIGAII
jgi:hypothetical protein